jgi:hypothetical protein
MGRYLLLVESQGPLDLDDWADWVEEADASGRIETAEFLPEAGTVMGDNLSAYAVIYAADAEGAGELVASYPGIGDGVLITIRPLLDDDDDAEDEYDEELVR